MSRRQRPLSAATNPVARAVSALPVVSPGRARDVLRAAFWLLPAVCVVVSIGLAIGLIALDDALPGAHAVFVFPGPPEGARSFLSAIIQSMIGFTGMVFSITIVVLQLSSGQFSPRVLRMFLGDRTIQFSLGLFVATFVYAMVVHRAVRGTAQKDGFVPRIAVTVAFVFVLASVAVFIRYITHISNMVRVATIIAHIGNQSRAVIAARYPVDQTERRPVEPLPPAVTTVSAQRAGVLVSVNTAALLDVGVASNCVLAVVPRVGEFVPTGAPLATVHSDELNRDGADLEAVTERARRNVALDIERTMEQDLAFGFRQLVDIAERALSPGVNDPTTAVQSLDILHDLLRTLAARQLPDGICRDAEGNCRVRTTEYTFGDFLDLAVAEIWRYGRDAAQVPERIKVMLDDVATVALPAHRAALAVWQRELVGHPSDEHPIRTQSIKENA